MEPDTGLPSRSSATPTSRSPGEIVDGIVEMVQSGARGGLLDDIDVEAGVDAAVAMRVAGYDTGEVSDIAELIGETAAGVRAWDLPAQWRRPVDWSPFGVLIPVLSGSPGAGASALAVAIVDALASAGRHVLLVDAADPGRSGLACAATAEGPWTSQLSPLLRIRYSWRQSALLARLESQLPVITPAMVPPPPRWLPELTAPHVTVVDIGHDGWRATANPLAGAGGWLRCGMPPSRPVLVVRPTRPSLRHAEQVLARLGPWVDFGAAAAPVQLVVTGAKRWPAGVVGAAGRCLTPLVDTAVFIPHNDDVELGGVTDALLGDKLLAAVTPMLTDWGLVPPTGRSRSRSLRRRQR